MSDYLDEKAEELLNDPIISEELKAKAREYLDAKTDFEEASETEITSREIQQKEEDQANLDAATAAGWVEYPEPGTVVKFKAGRWKDRAARVTVSFGHGTVNLELVDSPTLLTGIRLADVELV